MPDITMPQLGETVTEGTIMKWFKNVGDQVAEDEVLFEVSTDKVDSEVPSPAAGYIAEILVPEGETVEVGARLAVVTDQPPSAGSAPSHGEEAPSAGAAPEEHQPEPAAQPAPGGTGTVGDDGSGGDDQSEGSEGSEGFEKIDEAAGPESGEESGRPAKVEAEAKLKPAPAPAGTVAGTVAAAAPPAACSHPSSGGC